MLAGGWHVHKNEPFQAATVFPFHSWLKNYGERELMAGRNPAAVVSMGDLRDRLMQVCCTKD
jgi:hypothetical protein